MTTSRALKYYDLVGMGFVAVMIISNVLAQKLFAFGAFTFTAGVLIFPVSYIFGDILTEVYGYARARRVIWAGFAANLVLVLFAWWAVKLPPAVGWPGQDAFAATLGYVPRIVGASLIAYLVGEFANSFVLAKMKLKMGGRHLWARTIGSTLVGQALDTAVFAVVAFAGVLPWSIIVATTISGYIFKVVYEAAATPLTYLIVNRLKAAEGVDYMDEGTNFSPFATG